MNRKEKQLEEHINQLDGVAQSGDKEKAGNVVKNLISVYKGEIPAIEDGMSFDVAILPYCSGKSKHDPFSQSVSDPHLALFPRLDSIADARLLKEKLENRLANLQCAQTPAERARSSININNSVVQQVTNNITLEQTISNITQLPDTILAFQEREWLVRILQEMEGRKDKEGRWKIGKVILRWLADKGVDVAIAVLPYLLKSWVMVL